MNQPTPMAVMFPTPSKKPKNNTKTLKYLTESPNDGEIITSSTASTARNGQIFEPLSAEIEEWNLIVDDYLIIPTAHPKGLYRHE